MRYVGRFELALATVASVILGREEPTPFQVMSMRGLRDGVEDGRFIVNGADVVAFLNRCVGNLTAGLPHVTKGEQVKAEVEGPLSDDPAFADLAEVDGVDQIRFAVIDSYGLRRYAVLYGDCSLKVIDPK